MNAAECAASIPPDELIAVITAGLDADEESAKSTHRDNCHWVIFSHFYPCGCGTPSRVLADIESKRAILALHPYTTQRRSVGEGRLAAMYGRNWEKRLKNLDTPYCETCHVEDGVIDGGGPCDTLLALARPYLAQETPTSADH